jgi:hypothetical protein
MVPFGLGALAEVGRRPYLWATALRQWRAMVPPRWWARRARLPLPTRPYMALRLEAMFGPGGGRLSSSELVGYLEWCRWMRSLAR